MPRNTLGNLHENGLPPNFLRKWRIRMGMTQEHLAREAGVTNATVSRIEQRKQPFTSHTIQALARALGRARPADLMDLDPDKLEDEYPENFLKTLNPDQRRHALDVLKTVFKKH